MIKVIIATIISSKNVVGSKLDEDKIHVSHENYMTVKDLMIKVIILLDKECRGFKVWWVFFSIQLLKVMEITY